MFTAQNNKIRSAVKRDTVEELTVVLTDSGYLVFQSTYKFHLGKGSTNFLPFIFL